MAYGLFDVTKGILASVEVRGPEGTVRMGESDNHTWTVCSFSSCADRSRRRWGTYFCVSLFLFSRAVKVSRPDSDRQTISQSLNRNTVRSSGSDTGSKQPDHETENTFRESEAGKNPQACGTGAVKDRSERKPEASRAMAVFDLLSGCPYIDLRCNRRSLTAKLRARELFQLL